MSRLDEVGVDVAVGRGDAVSFGVGVGLGVGRAGDVGRRVGSSVTVVSADGVADAVTGVGDIDVADGTTT